MVELTLATLCFIFDGSQVLLGMKKRSLGAGYWNGFGGKVEPNESVEDAVKREVLEECHIIVEEMHKVAELTFGFPHAPKGKDHWNQLVHVYFCTKHSGTPQETDEMAPKWFPINEIPFDTMWEDDKEWLPLLLENKLVRGKFVFDKTNKIAESSNIVVVDSFD